MKRLLIQTQLSNYDTKGNFILECDSGWQMVMGRVREMLKLNPELDITVMGPWTGETGGKRQLITDPEDVNPDLWEKYGENGEGRLHYYEHEIIANALVTRYDFDWTAMACGLDLGMQKIGRAPKFDAVYINDPMHLRNFKALFHVVGGYQPKFFVHSHFVDVPEVPKFPAEASLWLGQCEAALKADYNFWQCETAMMQFFQSMLKWFKPGVVEQVVDKSMPWDDGYSRDEITSPINEDNMRFNARDWREKIGPEKTVLFFPNRISPSSGDYTNGMKFMFEVLPKLRQMRQDFVVVCGNPNQKFSNQELEAKCGHLGYVSLTPDTFNRDEFKFVARNSHIALGLYNADAYGGTAARECVELGCMPLWLDNYEYSSIGREAGNQGVPPVCYPYMARPDLSNLVEVANDLINYVKEDGDALIGWQHHLQRVIRQRCSYEATTPEAMRRMGLLDD